MNLEPLSIRNRARSFHCAVRGISTSLREQPNLWIIAGATVCTIAAGLTLRVNMTEWCMLLAAILFVWIVELLNTAIEHIVDLTSPSRHPLAGKAKDAAAGATLMAAILAFAVGMFILLPKALAWLR